MRLPLVLCAATGVTDGAGASLTSTSRVTWSTAPSVSVTVSVTSYVPTSENVCEAVTPPGCGPAPSPKSQVREAIPSSSVDVDESKVHTRSSHAYVNAACGG